MKTIIERPQENCELNVTLTEEQRVDRASRCSIQMVKLDDMRAEAKKSAADFRAKIKPLADEVRSLSVAYTTGKERMTVAATRVFDIASGQTWIAFDGQRFEEREITKYEMAGLVQKPLFPDRENAASAKEIDFDKMAETTPEQDIMDVIHEEQCVKTKVDHTVGIGVATDKDDDDDNEDENEGGSGG